MQAMFTGGRAFFGRDRKTDFQRTGTGERFAERTEELLEAENPHANLLKIGHHGSLADTALEVLQAVAPQFAVDGTTISARPVPR